MTRLVPEHRSTSRTSMPAPGPLLQAGGALTPLVRPCFTLTVARPAMSLPCLAVTRSDVAHMPRSSYYDPTRDDAICDPGASTSPLGREVPPPTVGNVFRKSREPSNIVATNSLSRKPVDPEMDLCDRLHYQHPQRAPMSPMIANCGFLPGSRLHADQPINPKTGSLFHAFMPTYSMEQKPLRSLPEHD